MTPTKDELARLAELEDLLTVGLVEQPINGSVLSWGEAALIAHRIGRHLLRASPVADTAGIDAAWREAASRYRAAEWDIRCHEDSIRDEAHNARVEEWRAADAAIAALLGESSPFAASPAPDPGAVELCPECVGTGYVRHSGDMHFQVAPSAEPPTETT